MSNIGWLSWQEELLDSYILGYTTYETQEELSIALGKNLNTVKIKLSRRRKQINEETRELTFEEYKLFLANRFDKTTKEIADIIGVSEVYLLHELDEIDALECKEYLEEGYTDRVVTLDEINTFIRLYGEGKNQFQMAHILNRPIDKIQELINNYEAQV